MRGMGKGWGDEVRRLPGTKGFRAESTLMGSNGQQNMSGPEVSATHLELSFTLGGNLRASRVNDG